MIVVGLVTDPFNRSKLEDVLISDIEFKGGQKYEVAENAFYAEASFTLDVKYSETTIPHTFVYSPEHLLPPGWAALKDAQIAEYTIIPPDQINLNRHLFSTRHYSPAEIAEHWGLSADAIRKLFEKEPGVLVIGNTVPRRGQRSYTTVRIPESVVERVHRRLSKV